MALETNNSRPNLPYQPKKSLPNNARFDLLTKTKRPPTAAMFDAEFNAIIDQINILADAINKVQAGSIPGSDAQENADKVLKTDGNGNLSWVKVTDQEMDDAAVTTRVLSDQSVTTDKMGDGAITHEKLAQGSVKGINIEDETIENEKLALNTITFNKLQKVARGVVLVGDGNQNINTIGGAGSERRVVVSRGGDQSPVFALIKDENVQPQGLTINSLAAASITALKSPTGSVTAFAGANAPNGWLLCDGREVSKIDYAALYAVIGDAYGVSQYNFRVPDLRGRSIFGYCGGTNNRITASTANNVNLAGVGGAELHTLTIQEMPAHNHPLGQNGVLSNVASGSVVTNGGGYYRNTAVMATDNVGGDQPHNNMPPFLLLSFIIKT